MKLTDDILELSAAMSAYNNNFNRKSEVAMIQFALGFPTLVVNINYALRKYLQEDSYENCIELIELDFKELTHKDYWLKGNKLHGDMKKLSGKTLEDFHIAHCIDGLEIKTTMEIYEMLEKGITEMTSLLKQVKKKLREMTPDNYGELFRKNLDAYDKEHLIEAYEDEKMGFASRTFEILKQWQTEAVANALKDGIMRCAPAPSMNDLRQVSKEKVKEYLSDTYELPDDFERLCAQFRKFIKWKGHIMKFKFNDLCIYLVRHYHQLTEKERRAIAELVIRIELIQEDMLKLPPEELKKVMQEKGEAQEEQVVQMDEDYYVSKMADALEEVQPYMWGNSANAVIFCALRDNHGFTDNMSRYERVWKRVAESRKLEWACPEGTLRAAFRNSSFYKLHTSRWKENDVPKRVMLLLEKFEAFYGQ